MDPRKLAQCYEEEILPYWDDLFVPFVMEAFPERIPEKASLLEMSCTTGRLTEELVNRLQAGGRVIAIEDIRDLMEIGRRKVAVFDHKQVFFKKEPSDKISFADETFDGVLSAGLATSYKLEDVLAEAVRLLKSDGFLLMGVALKGSFQELLDIFREVLEKEDLIKVQESLDRLGLRMPDRAGAVHMLGRLGLVETRVRTRESCVHFENALAFLQAPLIREHCLEACLALIQDRSWREGVLAGMVRSLDIYFPEGIDLTIAMGRLEGTKA
ncbi:MAG: methyltransferase domain-containing protein [Deltaproteobacteria bacterium]|nr:methyltransferase domain-containing protein [Deltaproteobacteria bacterium]